MLPVLTFFSYLVSIVLLLSLRSKTSRRFRYSLAAFLERQRTSRAAAFVAIPSVVVGILDRLPIRFHAAQTERVPLVISTGASCLSRSIEVGHSCPFAGVRAIEPPSSQRPFRFVLPILVRLRHSHLERFSAVLAVPPDSGTPRIARIQTFRNNAT